MWDNVYHFLVDNKDWEDLPIIDLNYQEIEGKVKNVYKRELKRLSKVFEVQRKNMEAMLICEKCLELLEKTE